MRIRPSEAEIGYWSYYFTSVAEILYCYTANSVVKCVFCNSGWMGWVWQKPQHYCFDLMHADKSGRERRGVQWKLALMPLLPAYFYCVLLSAHSIAMSVWEVSYIQKRPLCVRKHKVEGNKGGVFTSPCSLIWLRAPFTHLLLISIGAFLEASG